MREILWQVPAYRRYFRVEFAANGNPRRPGGQRRGDDHDQHRPAESKTWFPSGEALAVKRVWSERSLWLRWVFANAVGEALGLGRTALIGAAIVSSLGEGTSALATLALGPVLGFAQWLVLRRFVSHAALWMPANALAWAFGMAVIFASIDPAISGGFGLLSVVILGLTLACAGAVVGAIHGLALVWLLRSSE